MINAILLAGLIPFSVALLISIGPMIASVFRLEGRYLWLGVAWTAMFVGQAQMFGHEETVSGARGFDAGAFYQLGWMLFAFAVVIILMLGQGIRRGSWKVPVIALIVYAVIGIAGAADSPLPFMSIYKASQLLLDALLVTLAVSILVRGGKGGILLELTLFWSALILVSAALGGLLVPDQAFIHLGGGGVFGGMLRSVLPKVHSNQLGLLAAILFIVSLRRGFGQVSLRWRFYWLSLSLLSLSILTLAQSRTALIATLVATLLVSLLYRRLRWIVVLAMLAGIAIVSYLILEQESFQVNQELVEYARRGSTDEQLATFSGRLELWQKGWRMFEDSPLMGQGFETGVRYGGLKYGIAEGSNMHNAHLQVLADSGILGYVPWFLFYAGILFYVWRTLSIAGPSRQSLGDPEALDLFLIAFILLARSFMGHVLVSHQPNLLIFLALYVAALSLRQRRLTEAKNVDSELTESSGSTSAMGMPFPSGRLQENRLR